MNDEKWENLGGWDNSLECKKWVLAESLLFLNQKALEV
jgi:hypothetical protein